MLTTCELPPKLRLSPRHALVVPLPIAGWTHAARPRPPAPASSRDCKRRAWRLNPNPGGQRLPFPLRRPGRAAAPASPNPAPSVRSAHCAHERCLVSALWALSPAGKLGLRLTVEEHERSSRIKERDQS